MNLEQFDSADVVEMKEIERAIIAALMPYREKTDPLLALIALVRCARVMLRLGDREAQNKLLPFLEDYLRGKTTPRAKSNLLWTPGSH